MTSPGGNLESHPDVLSPAAAFSSPPDSFSKSVNYVTFTKKNVTLGGSIVSTFEVNSKKYRREKTPVSGNRPNKSPSR